MNDVVAIASWVAGMGIGHGILYLLKKYVVPVLKDIKQHYNH